MKRADPHLRLLELSRERGVSLAQLSTLIGRNPSYLQQFVRKRSPRKLEETDRGTLARFFAVSEAELGAPEEISFVAQGKARHGESIEIPRLALGASAGPGAFVAGEEVVGAFHFPAQWLRQQGLDPAWLSAIQVSGDSMEPTLRDGDEIFVDRAPRSLSDGIHVVSVDGALLVKRLDTGRPGVIGLISDNETFYPRLERPAGEVRVIGRVVWKGGRL
jgi:phage repressor protein C with HTH and peptisase S24 domain